MSFSPSQEAFPEKSHPEKGDTGMNWCCRNSLDFSVLHTTLGNSPLGVYPACTGGARPASGCCDSSPRLSWPLGVSVHTIHFYTLRPASRSPCGTSVSTGQRMISLTHVPPVGLSPSHDLSRPVTRGGQWQGQTWEMASPLAGSPRGAASGRGYRGKHPGHVREGHSAGGWL